MSRPAVSPRAFGLQVGGALVVLAVVLALRGSPAWPVALAPAVLLGVTAWLHPAALGLAARLWQGLSHALDRLTSPVVLRLVYYGLLVPVAALVRAEDRRGWQAPPTASGQVVPTELGLLAELWELLRTRRRLWLVPMLVVLFLLGLVLFLAEGTALMPFLYPVF